MSAAPQKARSLNAIEARLSAAVGRVFTEDDWAAVMRDVRDYLHVVDQLAVDMNTRTVQKIRAFVDKLGCKE